METVTFSFTVQGDSEGYITFECLYCELQKIDLHFDVV